MLITNTFTHKNRRKHLLIITGLIIFNLLSFNLFLRTSNDVNWQPIPYDPIHNLQSSLIAFLIGFPIISGIIGLLISVFPFKGLSFVNRYFRASQITLLVINALFAVQLLLIIFMTIMGWYPPTYQVMDMAPEQIEQKIKEFKKETITTCDSAIHYLDIGIVAAQEGQDPDEISDELSPKLTALERRLDFLLKDFHLWAQESGMTPEEYTSVIEELTGNFESVMNKHSALNFQGVEIKDQREFKIIEDE